MSNVTNYNKVREFQHKLIEKLPDRIQMLGRKPTEGAELTEVANGLCAFEGWLKMISGAQALQARLMLEELIEFLYADNLVDQIDAMLDMGYINYGGLARTGVDADKLFGVVHDANMTKLFPDGKPRFDEQGKLIKPDNFVRPEPKLKEELKRQTEEQGALFPVFVGDYVIATDVDMFSEKNRLADYSVGINYRVTLVRQDGGVTVVDDVLEKSYVIPKGCFKLV